MGRKTLCAASMFAVIVLAIACNNDRDERVDNDIVFGETDVPVSDDTIPDEDMDRLSTEQGIRTLMREHLLFTNGAGVAVGVEDRRVNWRIALAEGKKEMTVGADLEPDHLFRVASISKMFVATAVLRLTEQKKLDLSDTLDQWYPEYPEADKITVRMLLNHTSGISDYATPGEPEEIIADSAEMPRYFAPGTDWAYSNTNYVLLGRIVEKVSGSTLGGYLRSEVFDKGELTATSLEKEKGLIGTLASGHLYADDRLETYTGENPAWADGGIVSSVDDLAHFAARLFGGWILSTPSLDQMLAFVSYGGEELYGLGVLHYEDTIAEEGYGHNGSLTNYNGELVYFPKIKTSVAIQANYPVVIDNECLRHEILRLVTDPARQHADDACAFPEDTFPASPAGLYEVLRFKGLLNDIDAAVPEIGSGYYYFSGGTGLDNIFCNEYAFRYDSNGEERLYLLEECPEVERYYTGEILVKRFEFTIPIADLQPFAGKKQATLASPSVDYARLEYRYDPVLQRVTKRCFTALPASSGNAHVSICSSRNASFAAGEEIRVFAHLPLSDDIPEQQECTCYDEEGQTVTCADIEDEFGCPVPEGYFAAGNDAYAALRFVGAINDPNAASPDAGWVENDILFAAAPFDADSFNNFAVRTDNGLGTEVIILQSFGDFDTVDALTYTFNAAELIVPVQALADARTNEAQTVTGATDFYFSIHAYIQKARDGEVSYKKCFVAARDANDTAASLLPCYADNTDFAVGETLKLFGVMKLVDDPASLGLYWPTSDDCICFTAAGSLMNCADFDQL